MHKQLALGLLVAVAVAGCGGGSVGDAANGKILFNTAALGTTKLAGCFTCHAVTPGVTVNGPSLAWFGTQAETDFKAHAKESAHAYVRGTITAPDEEIASGFAKGVMPTTYGTALNAGELDDLAAYVLSLK